MSQLEREPHGNKESKEHIHASQSRLEAVQNLFKEAIFNKIIDPIKEVIRPHIFGIRCFSDNCPPVLNIRMVGI